MCQARMFYIDYLLYFFKIVLKYFVECLQKITLRALRPPPSTGYSHIMISPSYG